MKTLTLLSYGADTVARNVEDRSSAFIIVASKTLFVPCLFQRAHASSVNVVC